MTEELFIPYNEALALKKLGFNEPCLSYYKNGEFSDILELVKNSEMEDNNSITEYIAAPLYQQAFKFFRKEFKLYPEICLHDREDEQTWRFTISILGYYELAYNQDVGKEPYHKTYEEAELECLRKLIEIVND